MKLKIIKTNKKEEFLNVDIWSFIKCSILTSFIVAGIFYGILFFVCLWIGVVSYIL